MAKDPAFLFYYTDFAFGTRFLSFEEKGFYVELLCEQADKGFITKEDMIKICSGNEKIYERLWAKVGSKFSANGKGFYNERLRAEQEKRKIYSESRKNNRLGKKDVNNISKSCDLDMEDRNRIINKDENRNVFEIKNDVIKEWNDFAAKNGLTKVIKETEKRIKNINQRLIESDFNIYHIFQRIEQSDFLLGKNKQGWRVDFDFIFGSKNNWVKIMEGKYANNKTSGGATPDELRAIVQRRADREKTRS